MTVKKLIRLLRIAERNGYAGAHVMVVPGTFASDVVDANVHRVEGINRETVRLVDGDGFGLTRADGKECTRRIVVLRGQAGRVCDGVTITDDEFARMEREKATFIRRAPMGRADAAKVSGASYQWAEISPVE